MIYVFINIYTNSVRLELCVTLSLKNNSLFPGNGIKENYIYKL